MSAPDQQPPVEIRSSVKLIRNAKGDVQIEVKAVSGEDYHDLKLARDAAESHFNELSRAYS